MNTAFKSDSSLTNFPPKILPAAHLTSRRAKKKRQAERAQVDPKFRERSKMEKKGGVKRFGEEVAWWSRSDEKGGRAD
jgi:hypothetical protein